MNRIAIIAVALASGATACSSIVDDPCAAGYHFAGGACVAGDDLGPDAGNVVDPEPDDGGQPDGGVVVQPVCGGADLASDPDNCGACGHACASGICEAGHCLGELPGHVIAIGHDYRSHNAAMARVLANAVALGRHHDVAVARLHGSAVPASRSGTAAALAAGMAGIDRPYHVITIANASPDALAGIDVLVVDAQTDLGSAATAGAGWATALAGFLQHSGVVVVLEGSGGASHEFAAGAGLFTLAAPVDATGSPAFVAEAGDAIAQQVVTPYLADTTSVVFPGELGPIATPAGAIVIHRTRY